MSKKAQLINGAVEEPEVFAERTQREVTKMMKVVSITRTPQTLMARMFLTTQKDTFELEIDEPTVRAMIRVFDDFHADHPEGKAPPAPPSFQS